VDIEFSCWLLSDYFVACRIILDQRLLLGKRTMLGSRLRVCRVFLGDPSFFTREPEHIIESLSSTRTHHNRQDEIL